MNNENSLLEKLYERNPQNGNYIIEVALDTYADIFNEWDYAPFRRKDIDPDLLRFLEESMEDIPMKSEVDICFYLSDEIQNEKREQMIIAWFRNYYRLCIELERRKIKSLVLKSVLYSLASAAFLISSYLGNRISENDLLSYLLTQTVIVGGWVFLWEAISLLTFERVKIYRRMRNYNRFRRAAVVFRYLKTKAPQHKRGA